jgi:hypothetical protein
VGRSEGKKPYGIQGLYERIILKCVLNIGLEGLDWIYLA